VGAFRWSLIKMSANLSLRIFRRNLKKIILIWSANALPDSCRDSIAVFVMDDEHKGPIAFSKFVPDSPEKFSKDVDGIVILHAPNKIDPAKPCTIKILFGEGEESFEIVKDILPASASPVAPSVPVDSANSSTSGAKPMLMYGMNYKTGKWIPFPIDAEGDE
jgi:hypothetical protein